MIKHKIEHLRDLLIKGSFRKFFSEVKSFYPHWDPEDQDDFRVLEGRFNSLERAARKGVITDLEKSTTLNQIRSELLNRLSDMENAVENKLLSELVLQKGKLKNLLYWLLGFLVLFLLLIVLIVLIWSGWILTQWSSGPKYWSVSGLVVISVLALLIVRRGIFLKRNKIKTILEEREQNENLHNKTFQPETNEPGDYVKIKDVFIELEDYRYYHSSVDPENPSPHFIGREEARDLIKSVLANTNNPSGCYLVTGFRGMGKTSTVRQALQELKTDKTSGKKYTIIDVALSQEEVKDQDVLRQLARLLYLKWMELYLPVQLRRWLFIFAIVLTFLSLSLLFTLDKFKWIDSIDFNLHPLVYWIGYGIIALFLFLLLLKIFVLAYNEKKRNASQTHRGILRRLENLNNRLDAKVVNERSMKVTPQPGFSISAFNLSRLGPIGLETKKQFSYEIASAKEIEKELILILEEIHQLRRCVENPRNRLYRTIFMYSKMPVPHYIFLIDELDKIESGPFPSPEAGTQNSSAYNQLSQQRHRQEALAIMLANLKSFLNTAKAKFFFIGGREMYDASLADVSDRESFYSSIFSKVINIESFFKDKLRLHSGVTGMTEAFVGRKIIPRRYHFQPESLPLETQGNSLVVEADNLFKIRKMLDGDLALVTGHKKMPKEQLEAEKRKIIFLLQNLFIFLTYRSNGSPKRLIELFEQYLVSAERLQQEGLDSNKATIVHLAKHSHKPFKKRVFLRFGYFGQYEICFTSNLYRPYLILNSKHMKLMGDKLLYSSAFLLDNMIKFHNHAFSWRNLEIIPDIILINKDPNLRYFLQDILEFLSGMHIRQTVNALFQYKFYSKVTHELKYLSKISELSAAAFNFTLDESYLLKSWYKRNLAAKLQEYQTFDKVMGAGTFVHAIGYLQNILGDLHYYDREYDQAIDYYTAVIQPMRYSLSEAKHLPSHQMTLYVRTKLKIGLCLEKIRIYDSAYSIYRTLILNVNRMVGGVAKLREDQPEGSETPQKDEWEKPYRRMQLYLRPHIALLDLIEKQRADGITRSNLERNIQDYCKFLEIPNKFPSSEEDSIPGNSMSVRSDQKRIQTLLADYYNNVGSLLYYKNKNFLLLHEKAKKDSFGKLFQLQFQKEPLGLYPFTYSIFSRSETFEGNSIGDYYPTLSAFIYYEKALREVLRPYTKNIKQIQKLADLNESVKPSAAEQKRSAAKTEDNIYQILLTIIEEPYSSILNSTILYFIANLINKLGDATLACLSKSSTGDISASLVQIFLLPDNDQQVLKELRSHLVNAEGCHPHDFFSYNRVLATYRLTALFFKKAQREYSYAFQYKKLLFLIKDYLIFFKEDSNKIKKVIDICAEKDSKRGEIILETIATKLFQSITKTSNISNRPQMEKYHEIFQQDTISQADEDIYSNIYVNLSTAPEIREVMLLVEEIRLKLYRLSGRLGSAQSYTSDFYPKAILSANDLVSNMLCRMLELKYRSEYNWWELTELAGYFLKVEEDPTDPVKFLANASRKHFKVHQGNDLYLKFLRLNTDGLQVTKLHQLIVDSIFCLWETTRIFKNYEISYITNYSFQANVYFKLGNWVELYRKCDWVQKHPDGDPQRKSENDSLEQALYALIGKSAGEQMDQYFFYELAIQAYQKSIQMHRQGKAYKDINSNMHFLEDDYNDNLIHFNAAMERFRINIGAIRHKIDGLTEAVVESSNVYKYKSYFPH